MRLPNGDVLMHGTTPYDPVKAHEYYLKTRELKGRKPGRGQLVGVKTSSLSPSGKRSNSSFTVQVGGKKIKLTEQQLKEQKAYAQARVNSIKKKLADLNVQLKKRLLEAHQAEAKSKRPPTAAEKAASARESKKFRDKHHQEIATKAKRAASDTSKPKSSTGSDKTAVLRSQITDAKNSLVAAVERQRALSAATKNG